MQIMTDDTQEAARRFLRAVLHATGWTPYKLAKESRISASTLTRFLNSDVTYTISTKTLGKVRQAASKALQPDFIDTLWLTAQRPQTARHNASR